MPLSAATMQSQWKVSGKSSHSLWALHITICIMSQSVEDTPLTTSLGISHGSVCFLLFSQPEIMKLVTLLALHQQLPHCHMQIQTLGYVLCEKRHYYHQFNHSTAQNDTNHRIGQLRNSGYLGPGLCNIKWCLVYHCNAEPLLIQGGCHTCPHFDMAGHPATVLGNGHDLGGVGHQVHQWPSSVPEHWAQPHWAFGSSQKSPWEEEQTGNRISGSLNREEEKRQTVFDKLQEMWVRCKMEMVMKTEEKKRFTLFPGDHAHQVLF